MATPRLNSTKDRKVFCSLCKTDFKSEFQLPSTPPGVVTTDQGTSIEWSKGKERAMKNAKLAVSKEWDEHLRTVHPRQWEREQRKRARRRPASEPYKFPKDGK